VSAVQESQSFEGYPDVSVIERISKEMYSRFLRAAKHVYSSGSTEDPMEILVHEVNKVLYSAGQPTPPMKESINRYVPLISMVSYGVKYLRVPQWLHQQLRQTSVEGIDFSFVEDVLPITTCFLFEGGFTCATSNTAATEMCAIVVAKGPEEDEVKRNIVTSFGETPHSMVGSCVFVDGPTADDGLCRILFNLMAYMKSDKAEIDWGEEVTKKKKVGWKSKKTVKTRVVTPGILGPRETFRDKHTSVGAGTSPNTHWRLGHWRHQPCGKGRSETKLIWIRPILINAGKE